MYRQRTDVLLVMALIGVQIRISPLAIPAGTVTADGLREQIILDGSLLEGSIMEKHITHLEIIMVNQHKNHLQSAGMN